MTTISLKCDGKDLFEYTSDAIPRMNEIMDLDVDDNKGQYRVRGVVHYIFENKKDEPILSYVEIELIRMPFQD